jgi:hypothetical protein
VRAIECGVGVAVAGEINGIHRSWRSRSG